MEKEKIRRLLNDTLPLKSHEGRVSFDFVSESLETEETRIYATLRLIYWEPSPGGRQVIDLKEQKMYLGDKHDLEDTKRYRAFLEGLEIRMNATAHEELRAMLPEDLYHARLLSRSARQSVQEFAKLDEVIHLEPDHVADDVEELISRGFTTGGLEESSMGPGSTADLYASIDYGVDAFYVVLRSQQDDEIMGTVILDEAVATPVVFSPSGELLAVTVASQNGVRSNVVIYRVGREPVRYVDIDEIYRLSGTPDQNIEHLAFSEDERSVASLHTDGNFAVFRLER